MSEELKKELLVEGTVVEVRNATISKGPKSDRLFETTVSYKIDYTGFNLKELLILASRTVIIDLATIRNDKSATAHSVKKALDGKTFVWDEIKPSRKRAAKAPATAAEVGELFLKKASEDDMAAMIAKLQAELDARKAAETEDDDNE